MSPPRDRGTSALRLRSLHPDPAAHPARACTRGHLSVRSPDQARITSGSAPRPGPTQPWPGRRTNRSNTVGSKKQASRASSALNAAEPRMQSDSHDERLSGIFGRVRRPAGQTTPGRTPPPPWACPRCSRWSTSHRNFERSRDRTAYRTTVGGSRRPKCVTEG